MKRGVNAFQKHMNPNPYWAVQSVHADICLNVLPLANFLHVNPLLDNTISALPKLKHFN